MNTENPETTGMTAPAEDAQPAAAGDPDATGDSPAVPAAAQVSGIDDDQRSEGEISVSKKEGRKKSTRHGRAGKVSSVTQEGGARRGSMFEEAKDAKALLAATGGNLNETLQGFFTHKSNSFENISKKPIRRPKKIYENTYRLESYKPFCSTIVQSSMKAIMDQMLDQMKYNSETAITTAAAVAEKIRARVLTFEFDRYKILVHVTIGPMSRQGVHQGFRCVWDSNRDSYAQAIFRNHNIFASAVVYAIYFE